MICGSNQSCGKQTIHIYRQMKEISFRRAALSDVTEIKRLFTETVLTINRKDYTAEETADWASCGERPGHWERLIGGLHFIVAVNAGGRITGFAAMRRDGYLHSMFVRKDYQRQGIATQLLRIMEGYAVANGLKAITSEVSITARPFFERHGYDVLAEQQAQANKLRMTNYKMAKTIR